MGCSPWGHKELDRTEVIYHIQKFLEHMTEVRGEAVHVCARILLKYTLHVDEENKVGGKLTVWFRSLLSLLGEPT